MAVQSNSFLKNENTDFNNILDTIPNAVDDFTVISAAGNTDLSTLAYKKSHTVLISAALADDNYIRLPEATTSNGGMHIKVIFGIAALDAVRVGFVTTKIQGGATAIGDTNEGNAPTDIAAAIADNGDNFLRLEFDLDTVARAGATGGTELNFYYFGEANKVIYRGHLISEIDDPTLANHFSTATILAA
tara:strand:- start:92 stop:658 length:567 start_codon:yes stop_codon:yes gene_type:complete